MTRTPSIPLGGWETYRLFAVSVKANLRYVRYRAANDFLDNVLDSCGNRKIAIPQGSIYWRARLGGDPVKIASRRTSLSPSAS